QSFNLLPSTQIKDTSNLKIFLTEKPNQLKEVEIVSEKVIPIVRNKSFYVFDYYILFDGNFLLITYHLNGKGFDVSISSLDNQIIFKKTIFNEEPFKIFKDCMGNLNILSDKYSRQVIINSDSSFEFLSPTRRGKFDSIVAPCALKIENELFFNTFNKEGLIKGDFYGFDTKINSNVIFYYKIKNGRIKPVRFITYNKELQQTMDTELKNEMDKWAFGIGAFYQCVQQMENERINTYSVVFKKIYAPVFLKNDTMVLFNFQEMEIEYYNKEGVRLSKVALDDKSFNELHNFEVITDRKTSKFYIFNKETIDRKYLNEINIYTGLLMNQIKIEKPLATNIQVYADKIYYIVREKEFDDTAYLYYQKK
ncbi:MAG TPA: hypothetical protein VN026_15075, partial [Bacteroidia bacterium]|nr:hypothetical protein [Bacteroidia bacterium]